MHVRSEAPALFEFIAQTMTARATTLVSPNIFGSRHFIHYTPIVMCDEEGHGAVSVGLQRHRLSLVRCVPPHQRSIGL